MYLIPIVVQMLGLTPHLWKEMPATPTKRKVSDEMVLYAHSWYLLSRLIVVVAGRC